MERNETILGYIALRSTVKEFMGEIHSVIKNYGTVQSIEARSVVTDSPVIPTEIFVGEGAVVSVVAATVQVDGGSPDELLPKNGDDLTWTIEPVAALAVTVQKGRILLLDILDAGETSLALHDFSGERRMANAELIGAISVSGVYRISVQDRATRQSYKVGYQIGATVPDQWTVRINKAENPVTAEFTSWQNVAMTKRQMVLDEREAAQKKVDRAAEEEARLDQKRAREEAEAQRDAAESVDEYLATRSPLALRLLKQRFPQDLGAWYANGIWWLEDLDGTIEPELAKAEVLAAQLRDANRAGRNADISDDALDQIEIDRMDLVLEGRK